MITIKKWYNIESSIFVDINNTLYGVIDNVTLKLAENVGPVGIAHFTDVVLDHKKNDDSIYWSVGSTCYRYCFGKTTSWKLDSNIKSIEAQSTGCFILTVDGNLYLQSRKDYLDDYAPMLPLNTNYNIDPETGITDPILIKSNVYQISVSDSVLLLVS